MVIEIRKNHATIGGKGVEKGSILKIEVYGSKENPRRVYTLDFRQSKLREVPKLEIRNKSGHGLRLVGTNDWSASLKTSEAIKAEKGLMVYMSQYKI